MAIPRFNIKKITVQNFKFFQQPLEFELNGNHLLLYGENGSGKSSLYWALYTLLECANKEKVSQIQKYFDPNDDEKLTNIFLTPGNPDWIDSEIKIELEDSSIIAVSFNDTTINSNPDAQAANYASDFLNYKMIFQLQNFAHSEDINIFNYFAMYVLPYVKFAPVRYWLKNEVDQPITEKDTENAKQIWDFVKAGPPKTGKTKQRIDRYPIQKEPDYEIYSNLVTAFKNELNLLLTFINTEGNPILSSFGYEFSYKLEMVEYEPFKLSSNNFIPPKIGIYFSLPDFYHKTGVKKPHTFLNEAKLSALGLAIRFAILKKRLQDSKLKLAILDDFMISLDMKNRDVALDYISTTIAPDYQLIFLTHDTFLYELTKDKINRLHLRNWTFYKMFEDENLTKTNLKPILIKEDGQLNKAKSLFKAKDFTLSANVLRKGAEKFCKAYLTKIEQLDVNYNPKKLDGLILKVIEKGTLAGLDANLLSDLMEYKDRIMNPSSHYDIETPLFSNEIKKAIETLEKLSVITGINI